MGITAACTGKDGATGTSEMQKRRHSACDSIARKAVVAGRKGRERKVSHARITDYIILDTIPAWLPEILIDIRHNQNTIVNVPADPVALDEIINATGKDDAIAN